MTIVALVLLGLVLLPAAAIAAPETTTTVLTLAASSDDVVEANDSTVALADGTLEVGRGSGPSTITDVGLRFAGAPIPPGATIQEAHLVFTAYSYGLETGVSTALKGLKVPNAATFSATNRPSQNAKTTASVPWSLTAWTANTVYNSPDLTTVIQEIINQPGWAQGNALALAWEDNGTSPWKARIVYSRDFWSGSSSAPKLSVTYAPNTTPDTTPPVVSVTSPAAGAVLNGVVSVTSSASDNRAVTRVDFLIDGLPVGSDSSAPYSYSWDTALYSVGPHAVRAVAFDAAGNSSFSEVACSVYRDEVAPTISSVTTSAVGISSASVVWTTDEPATSRVEYGTTASYGSMTTLDPSLVTSHSVALSGLLGGTTYHYRVISADAAGNSRTSGDYSFTTAVPPPDTTPPTVSVTAPNEGAVLNGVVSITATAADNLGVTRVDFFVDGLPVGSDASAPYAFSWNTALYSVGPHAVRAVAIDAAGNSAFSEVACSIYRDEVAPVISAVGSGTPGTNSAQVTWTTNEAATSRVEYGTTTAYGSQTTLDAGLVTAHSVSLTALTAETTYHYRVLSTDAAGNAAVSGDYTFTTAAAPLTTTAVMTLVAAADDVVEGNDSTIALADGSLEVGRGNGSTVTDIGLRFAGAPIPRGAVITEAHLSVTGYGYGLESGVSTVFKGLKVPSVATFSATNRPSQNAKTTQTVPWSLTAWTADTVYNSPDLAAIIQEIIDQPGWTQGNALGLAWEDNGTSAWRARIIYSRDFWSGTSNAPKLSVTYAANATPDTVAPTVSLTAPTAGAVVSGVTPMTATASDDRAVARVDFLVDGLAVGSDTTAPYGASWDTALYATGPHTLRAVAFDAAGNSSASETTCTVYRDETPPTISGVGSGTPTSKTALVSWTTNEAATSRVEYGTTTAYGSLTTLDASLVTAHAVPLSGLTADTTYHYRVLSSDSAGNAAVSGDFTFKTSAAPDISKGPIVSFAFDDNPKSDYTAGFPVLQAAGYPGTVYVVTNTVGDTGDQLSLADLTALQNAGWEISSHAADHNVGASTPIATYEASVASAKSWLDSNGFPNSGFAPPGGAWSHNIVSVARKYHPYLRVADNIPNEPPWDPYMLSSRFIAEGTTVTEAMAWLDEAQRDGEWLIITSHSVTPHVASVIQALCNGMKARGIPSATVRDVLNASYPPELMLECWKDSIQSPVFVTREYPSALSPTAWNEYWEAYFGYPVMEAMSGQTLPTMTFSKTVPNGTYKVYANLYSSADRQFRYFYSFNDPSNPEAMHIDLPRIDEDLERYLGVVTVTNGRFSLYTRRIDALNGDNWYGAWCWIRLEP